MQQPVHQAQQQRVRPEPATQRIAGAVRVGGAQALARDQPGPGQAQHHGRVVALAAALDQAAGLEAEVADAEHLQCLLTCLQRVVVALDQPALGDRAVGVEQVLQFFAHGLEFGLHGFEVSTDERHFHGGVLFGHGYP
mgnify:CR=1 FL=1